MSRIDSYLGTDARDLTGCEDVAALAHVIVLDHASRKPRGRVPGEVPLKRRTKAEIRALYGMGYR